MHVGAQSVPKATACNVWVAVLADVLYCDMYTTHGSMLQNDRSVFEKLACSFSVDAATKTKVFDSEPPTEIACYLTIPFSSRGHIFRRLIIHASRLAALNW